MKNLMTFIGPALFMLLFLSCGNSVTKEKESDSPNTSRSVYGEEVSFSEIQLEAIDWDLLTPETLYIIRTQEEFEEVIVKDKEDNIDFSKNSLLLVRGQTNYGIAEREKTIYKNQTGNYTLLIDISLNDATVMQAWNEAVLIPSIPTDNSVKLEIDID